MVPHQPDHVAVGASRGRHGGERTSRPAVVRRAAGDGRVCDSGDSRPGPVEGGPEAHHVDR